MTTTFTRPAIPPILTRADWDKKKGVFAKMSGKTGIGEECAKVAQLYKDVKWDRFDLPARRTTVMKNWRDDTFTKGNWDKLLNEAKNETLTSLAKLSTELYKLRDLCLATEKKFKASKTIPKSSTEHVKKMADAADKLGVQLNKNSMGGVLKGMNDDFTDWMGKAIIGDCRKAAATVPRDLANLMRDLRADPTPKNLNGPGRTDLRRVTQAVGNIAKLGERGFVPPVNGSRELFKQLTPYADPNEIVPSKAGRDEVLATLDKIEPIFRKSLAALAGAKI
jgi:hypothetical protein